MIVECRFLPAGREIAWGWGGGNTAGGLYAGGREARKDCLFSERT